MLTAGLLAMAVFWVVKVPVADLLSEPSPEADMVSQAILGATVQPVEERGEWMRIRTPDGYQGWALASDLARREEPYAEEAPVWIDNLFANIYYEPDVTSRRPALTAPYDARLELAETPENAEQRWIQVALPDGRRGWVQRGDLRFDDEALSIGEVVALARRFVGLPYLWGGVSSFGFDCSGFTQMLCRRRGIRIPRDSGPQARWEGMRKIRRADLEAGDLLFFGASQDKITHTGMYIGGGEFIHATAYRRPMVQISRLDDPHWSGLLVACRRPKGEAE